MQTHWTLQYSPVSHPQICKGLFMSSESPTLSLTKQLIARAAVTPDARDALVIYIFVIVAPDRDYSLGDRFKTMC